jgi:multiple sugar transport system permease protein
VSTVPGQAIFRDVPETRRVGLRQKVWNSRFDYLYVAPAIIVMLIVIG